MTGNSKRDCLKYYDIQLAVKKEYAKEKNVENNFSSTNKMLNME